MKHKGRKVQCKKLTELTATLYEQFAEFKRLEAVIKKNMEVLGYEQ